MDYYCVLHFFNDLYIAGLTSSYVAYCFLCFQNIVFFRYLKYFAFIFQAMWNHSHKKQKVSLQGSLDGVLFPAELEFPKMLVPRLPQNTSNVIIECTKKSKQLYSLYDQLLGVLIYLDFIVLILICFYFIISGENYALSSCSSLRKTPRVPLCTGLTVQEKHCCSFCSR